MNPEEYRRFAHCSFGVEDQSNAKYLDLDTPWITMSWKVSTLELACQVALPEVMDGCTSSLGAF